MSKIIVPNDVRELSREHAPAFYKRLNRSQPDQIAVGQIWSTYQNVQLPGDQQIESAEPRLIVILVADQEDLVAALISISIQMAAEYDLILQRDTGPLGFDFMVEVWNETPVIPEQLRQYLGVLDNQFIEYLIKLHVSYLLNESVPETVRPYVGPALGQEDDMRAVFQTEEIRSVEYLARAATASLSLARAPFKQKAESRKQVINLGQSISELLDNVLGHRQAIAHATGGQAEDIQRSHFVAHEDEDYEIVLELLVRRKREVYVRVHQVGRNLAEKRGVIILRTDGTILRSEPTVLEAGKNIELGTHKGFQPDTVAHNVELELLDDIA